MKPVFATLAGLMIAGALAAAAVVGLGLYDISATDQHLRPTYRLLDASMRSSVARRARNIVVPGLEDAALRDHGMALYDANCLPCHGAPGVAPEPFALGLTPAPANLAHTAREWSAAQLYWVVRHGIKMTGMPAWAYRLPDDDLWAIVAFLQVLPSMRPQDYRARTGRTDAPRAQHEDAEGKAGLPGNAARGKRAIQQYACVTCHQIPGIVGANAPVGPPLRGVAQRKILAGVLPNTPANLVRWLRAPHGVSPATAMPDLGLTPQHAADIAAYLSTLD